MIVILSVISALIGVIIYRWPLKFILISIVAIALGSELYFSTPLSEVYGAVYAIDLVIVALHIFLIWWTLEYSKDFYDKKIVFFIFAFLFMFYIGILRGVLSYGHSAVGYSRSYGFYALFLFVVLYGLQRQKIPKTAQIINWIIILGLISLLYSGINYISYLSGQVASPHRAFGNTRGLFIACSIISLIVIKTTKIHISKFVDKYNNYINIILVIGLLLSAQRGVWIAIIPSLLLSFIILDFKYGIKLLFSTFLVVIIIVSIFYFFELKYFEQISQDLFSRVHELQNHFESNQHSVATRLFMWEIYLKRFLGSPLFGEGAGYRLIYFNPVLGKYSITEAHNEYLVILVQRGIVGFLPMIGIFVLVLKRLAYSRKLKMYRNPEFALFIISGTIFFCTSIWLFFTADNTVVWIALGIFIWSYNEVRKQHKYWNRDNYKQFR